MYENHLLISSLTLEIVYAQQNNDLGEGVPQLALLHKTNCLNWTKRK